MAALAPSQRILCAVGAIVLTCQEIERHMKFLIPFTNADDPTLASILARHAKLARRSLGEVAGQFVGAMSGDLEALESYVRQVVFERNELVHHFHERHGDTFSRDAHELLESLRTQHSRALLLLRLLREMALAVAETMRDSVFAGTPEHDEIVQLCEGARASLAS